MQQAIPAENKKTGRQFLRLAKNNLGKIAGVANLVYVSDTEPGYTRKRRGKQFYYQYGNKKITDSKILDRFKKLVIPPAWENVWICKSANGHLQATGYDKLHRKQYRYHPAWNTLRNHTKFYSLLSFGKQLPVIRTQLQSDLALPGFPQEKVLAAVVSLLDRTSIRIGNSIYEKLYGSFGLTTMKNKHVTVKGSGICFTFTGKKGIKHHITLKSKKLSRIIKGCREIPGKKLFEYYDEDGNIHPIDSGMVNSYIQRITNENYTAKDFRTWAASVQSLIAFRECGNHETETDKKQKINTALDMVAKQLGNTRAVCKKYYVHPSIIGLYENQGLDKYIANLRESDEDDELNKLAPEEKILIKLLKEN